MSNMKKDLNRMEGQYNLVVISLSLAKNMDSYGLSST